MNSAKSTSRVVVITGGTSGIGLECVKKFAATGDMVVTCARSTFDFQNQAMVGVENVRLYLLDLRQDDAITRLIDFAVKEFGRIDVLINNAAVVPMASLDELSGDDFQATIDVNLRPVFMGAQTAFQCFKSLGGGTIINMSSMAAVDPFPGFSLYGGCKAWIETFTQAIAAEGRDHGIFCAAIRAGAVETPLLRKVLPDFPSDQAISPQAVADLIYATVNQRDFSISGKAIPIMHSE